GDHSGAVPPRDLVRLRELRLHDRAVRGVPDRGHGGNESRAVRPAGSRIGAGGRIPYRVQRLPLVPLLPGRVRQYLRSLLGCGDAVLGRLAAAVPERKLARSAAGYGVSGGAVCRLRVDDPDAREKTSRPPATEVAGGVRAVAGGAGG